jgi:hypothetical protein
MPSGSKQEGGGLEGEDFGGVGKVGLEIDSLGGGAVILETKGHGLIYLEVGLAGAVQELDLPDFGTCSRGWGVKVFSLIQ